MTVRAKFYVRETRKNANGGSVIMSAVCRGEDNKKWASATPVANLEMTILTEALEQFEVGDEYYVDFTPAPKGQVGMDL